MRSFRAGLDSGAHVGVREACSNNLFPCHRAHMGNEEAE
jgi:hypothetical protein